MCAPFGIGLIGVSVVPSALTVVGTGEPSINNTAFSPGPAGGTTKLGLLFEVLLSILLAPVSVPAVMSGATAAGGTGAVRSTIIGSSGDRADSPFASVNV